MLKFQRRVTKDDTYLWGGAAVEAPLDAKLVLIMQNDENGEQIEFGQRKKPDGNLTLGKLDPGQSYALSLHGLIGVFAKSTVKNVDSFVNCTVTTIE